MTISKEDIMTDTPKRGFAAMSKEKHREIAAKGGRAISPEKRAFSQNRDLASAAGKSGGSNVAPDNRSFSRDRTLAASAGRKGGSARRNPEPPEAA